MGRRNQCISVFSVYLALRGTDARQPTDKGRDVPFPLAIILDGQAQCVSSGLRQEGHLTVKLRTRTPCQESQASNRQTHIGLP